MPHSSGGGFHGGGSHGGGFHGGSGYHGGFGRSGSGQPGHRIMHHSFLGARRYYYWHGNRLETVYSDDNISAPNYRRKRLAKNLTLIFAPFLAVLVFFTALGKKPEKINSELLSSGEIIIEDTIDVLSSSEEEAILSELETFKDKSGIPVKLVFITEEEWHTYMDSINMPYDFGYYCYEEYVHTFDDECHWLIIYACDDTGLNRFEGMQGNFTDDILTNSLTLEFDKTLYDNLGNQELTVGQSYLKAFQKLDKHVMRRALGDEVIGFMVLVYGMGFYSVIRGIFELIKTLSDVKSNKYFLQTDETEIDCPKCYSTFILNPDNPVCPHCGGKGRSADYDD